MTAAGLWHHRMDLRGIVVTVPNEATDLSRVTAPAEREGAYRRLRLLLLLATLFVLAAAFLGMLAQKRDALVARAVRDLRPGMTQPEVRALLRPLRADRMITPPAGAGAGEYLFRGIDEFVVVVMDGAGEGARVVGVQRLTDTGPFWERLRRNWEARFR